jgi:hypothetical protein
VKGQTSLGLSKVDGTKENKKQKQSVEAKSGADWACLARPSPTSRSLPKMASGPWKVPEICIIEFGACSIQLSIRLST